MCGRVREEVVMLELRFKKRCVGREGGRMEDMVRLGALHVVWTNLKRGDWGQM